MRRLLAALVLVTGAFAALAGDVLTPTADLVTAIDARIGVIGSPAPDAMQAAEAKKLAKARAKFLKYTGTVDKAGLTTLAAGGKLLVQSKTTDPGVTVAAAALADALAAELGATDAEILNRLTSVYTIVDREKAQALLDAARARVAEAAVLAPTDLAGALSKLLAAATNYAKARSHVEKTIARLDVQKQPLFNDPLTVLNLNGRPAVISFVAWDVVFTPPAGEPLRVKAKFKDFQDAASGYVLPYKMVDAESELPLYPTFHAALTAAYGGSPNGGTVTGSMRFVSTKHGTVDVPIDLFVGAP